MSVLFNKVLVSREAGSLIPSLNLDKVSITDMVINSIKLDSGDTKLWRVPVEGVNGTYYEEKSEPIVSNPDNLPLIPNNAWSTETQLYANFNGDLEAGPMSFYGAEIDGMAIRRSSNRDNFSKWEDIKIINDITNVVNEDNEYSFKDRNIESGVWYLYAIQPMSKGDRGSLFRSVKRAVIYDSAYLLGENGKQLNLKFDTSVSSYKRNIKESRVETIGSKYPFITRNANVDYIEFPITGLITHFMDESKEFAPRAELFVDDEFADSTIDLTLDYDALYRAYDINDYNNTTLEREFREKVHDFLLDGNPKLFKSPKHGNVLVRLMDVNLSPREDINGGMVYNFSCNAIQIDDATIENLEKYNIQKR